MTINNICNKLVKSNIRSYIVLMFCLTFGVLLHTSYGLLVFSPTVMDIVISGGTTNSILCGFYIALGISILYFISYILKLFLKYKSKDLGVFIALGITPDNAKKILYKELKYIIVVSISLGLVLSLPTVYILWNIIGIIFQSGDMKYLIGWNGLIGGIVFSSLIFFIIKLKISNFLQNKNLISVLKNKDEVEVIAEGSYIKGIIGICFSFVGIFLWERSSRGLIFESIPFVSTIFAILSIIGIYMMISQISSLGKLIKKISKRKYYKNIVFYNLLKLRGYQYRNTLFAITILISITMFIVTWTLIDPFASKEIADLEYSFDYSIKKGIDQNEQINKDVIYDIAQKNDINISDYYEMESIQLYINKKFGKENSRSLIRCIGEDDYNRIYKKNIDVKPGNYCLYSSNKELILNDNKNKEFYTLSDEYKYLMNKQDVNHEVIVSGTLEFYVLDQNDYFKFRKNTPVKYIDTFLQFNVDQWKNSDIFFENIREYMYKSNENGLKIRTGFSGNDYRDQTTEFIKYKDLKASDYRWWVYSPVAKIYSTNYLVKDTAIYSLLYLYIAILAVVAISLVLYIKITNISSQDENIYKKMIILGSSKKDIKRIITNQLIIIFSIPTLIGVSVGCLISIAMKSTTLSINITIKYSIFLALLYMIIQIIILMLTRNSIIKNIHIDNLTDYID